MVSRNLIQAVPAVLPESLQYLRLMKDDLVAITHISRRPAKATESPREQSSPPPVATCDEATSASSRPRARRRAR